MMVAFVLTGFITTLMSQLAIVNFYFGAVVVAQFVERSLPIPDVRGSNPVISNKYIEHLLSPVFKRRKEKEAVNGAI